jgi:GH15 family glucan-1,4-alpha-glucosidase
VRIGNGAVVQKQTDVLGEVMAALHHARAVGLEESDDSWALQRALVDDLAEHWDEPDHGLWEVRGPTRHFTHSRVMVWVACDRADAALLVIPAVGFLEGDDPRVLGTIRAVEEDLLEHGLLLRYRTETGVDGIRGDENPFLACSFWLVSALSMAGRGDDARTLMDRLLEIPNDVGLLPEEFDPVSGRFAGNFPQAFSHLALVGAAIELERATG